MIAARSTNYAKKLNTAGGTCDVMRNEFGPLKAAGG
jgi:hypothetical protein